MGISERIYDLNKDEKGYGDIYRDDDGPSWYYGNHGTPSAQSPLQAFNMMCMNAGVGVEVKFCPNCGAKRADNAKFCTECGARLEN